jgi:hypothetical protein
MHFQRPIRQGDIDANGFLQCPTSSLHCCYLEPRIPSLHLLGLTRALMRIPLPVSQSKKFGTLHCSMW